MTYEFIQVDPETGNAIIPAEKIIPLANYIKQLEELNKNYLEQIKTLEEMIATYEAQIEALKSQVKNLEEELEETKQELEIQKFSKLVFEVLAVIAAGTAVYIFVKGG